MAATIKVGRAGALSECHFSTLGMGDRVRVEGHIRVDADTDVAYVAEQFVALPGNADETFVPVLFGEASWMDGFYRVVSADVIGQMSSYWALSLDLERVRGYAAPVIESRLLGAKRSGLAAGVTAVPWHAVPNTASGYLSSEAPAGQVAESATGESGTVAVVTDTDASAYDSTVTYYVAPASWYVGASSLTVGGQVVVGRQCRNLPKDWKVSNGLVRVSYSASPKGLLVERWNGTAWVSLGVHSIGFMISDSYGGMDGPYTLTVLRNAAECVSVRVGFASTTMSGFPLAGNPVAVDVTLRRGSRAAEVVLSASDSRQYCVAPPFDLAANVTGTGGAAVAASGAAVAFGSGVAAAAPNRVQLASAGTRLVLGLGHVAGTVDAAAVTAWVSRYAAAQVESVRAVAR